MADFQWKPPVDREVSEELSFHLEMRTRELIARGMDPVLARAEAARRLGDLDQMRSRLTQLGAERERAIDRTRRLGELWADFRFGVRTLIRQPAFSLVALATLSLGVGATTAIFSVLNTVVLRPLPVPDPDRIVVVAEEMNGAPSDVSIGNYTDVVRHQGTFGSLSAGFTTNLILSGDGESERVVGGRVTSSYFTVFATAPLHGRTFGAAEDVPGQGVVAVLSHRFWVRRFGADPAAVGRTILLNNEPHTVIGVMPARFDFFANSEDLWVPAAFTEAQKAEHDGHFLTVYGRLKPGVTAAQATADLAPLADRLRESYPDQNPSLGFRVTPVIEAIVGDTRERIWVLLGAVSLVLVIGCVNVANLLLARGATRGRELAVRAALGAGRGRIVRQLFAENLALAAGASVLGVVVAAVTTRLIKAAAPENVPRLDQLTVDGTSIVFALAVALTSALVFGLIPAVKIAGPDLFGALREGSRGASSSSRDWLRQGLVAAEVMLAMLLLAGAGLLIRTAIHLGRIDPGFDPRGVLSARVSLPRSEYGPWLRVTNAFTRMEEELARQPGVVAVAVSSQVPMGPGGGSNGLIPEGKTLEGKNGILSRLRIVNPGYHAAMRIPLRKGRLFEPDDRQGRPRVMLINETLARLAFPGQDPIGKRFACCEAGDSLPEGGWKRVVGVVADVRADGPAAEAPAEFYLPIQQAPPDAWGWVGRTMTVAIRTRGDPSAFTGPLREAIRAVDPALPVFQIATMDQRIGRSLAESRFNTQLLVALGVLGLVLAVVGIYGVVAFFVARRTREIGIRSALGATRGAIRALVLREGLIPVAAGLGVGLVASVLATRVLASQLRGVTPGDPITLAAVAVALLAVAALAILVPASAATRIDATTAMREE